MLVKDYLSKTLNSVSAFAVVLAVSGFVCATPSWAMEEDESDKETHVCPIMSLPDEALLDIMSYKGMSLNDLSLVSKHFHMLSCDKTFGRKLFIDTENKLWDVLRSDQCSLDSVPNMRVILPSGKLEGHVLGVLLRGHPCLRSLDLSGNTIDKEGAKALGEALKTNSSLIHLNLEGINLGKGGALALFTALQSNNTLTSLDLQRTLNDDTGKEKVYTALGGVITTNPNLRVLNLSDNWMNKDGLAKLCEALPSSHIEVLDLSNNDFSYAGVPLLASVLKGNSSLKELNLSLLGFGKKGAREIASALKENTSLEKLWMDSHHFGLSGAKAWVEAIQTHPALKFLSLSFPNPNEREKEFLKDIVLKGKERNIEVKVGFDL